MFTSPAVHNTGKCSVQQSPSDLNIAFTFTSVTSVVDHKYFKMFGFFLRVKYSRLKYCGIHGLSRLAVLQSTKTYRRTMGVGVLADAVSEYIVGLLTLLWRHYICDKFINRRNYGAGKHFLSLLLAACSAYLI
jgi:hypothetical protein